MDVQDFLFYKMTIRNFQQRDGEVAEAPGGGQTCILRSVIVPRLKPTHGPCKLSSASDPGCMVTAQGCLLQFRAGTYFADHPDPPTKWKYEIDAQAAAAATGTFFRNQHAQANQQANSAAAASGVAPSPLRHVRVV